MAGFGLARHAVIAVLGLAMRFCGLIQGVVRDSGMTVLTRISGLLLSAIAVQLAAEAIRVFVKQG